MAALPKRNEKLAFEAITNELRTLLKFTENNHARGLRKTAARNLRSIEKIAGLLAKDLDNFRLLD